MATPAMNARSLYGVAVRLGTPEEITEARRELVTETLISRIRRHSAGQPRLHPHQAARVVAELAKLTIEDDTAELAKQ